MSIAYLNEENPFHTFNVKNMVEFFRKPVSKPIARAIINYLVKAKAYSKASNNSNPDHIAANIERIYVYYDLETSEIVGENANASLVDMQDLRRVAQLLSDSSQPITANFADPTRGLGFKTFTDSDLQVSVSFAPLSQSGEGSCTSFTPEFPNGLGTTYEILNESNRPILVMKPSAFFITHAEVDGNGVKLFAIRGQHEDPQGYILRRHDG